MSERFREESGFALIHTMFLLFFMLQHKEEQEHRVDEGEAGLFAKALAHGMWRD